MGPQGAPGPQGATGPQGAPGPQGATGATGLAGTINDYDRMTFENAVSLASFNAGGTVMNVIPGGHVTGVFNVVATADITQYHLVAACKIRVESEGSRFFSSTPYDYANRSYGSGTIAETGVVDASERSSISEVCYGNAKTSSAEFASAYAGADMTAVQVTHASGTRTAGLKRAASSALKATRPSNMFVNPFTDFHSVRHQPAIGAAAPGGTTGTAGG